MTADQIVADLRGRGDQRWVCVSGGEPTLQYDEELQFALTREGYAVAIETNGSRKIPFTIHHITMSPKQPREKIALEWCHDLKLLFPHPFLKPEDFEDFPAKRLYLQPIDNDNWKNNIDEAVKYCLASGGKWKLSMQIHKLLGVE